MDDHTLSNFVAIPPEHLSPEALQGVIEEFITREGTDYGAVESSFAAKIEQVRAQLRKGLVTIVFDLDAESCTLLTREQLQRLSVP